MDIQQRRYLWQAHDSSHSLQMLLILHDSYNSMIKGASAAGQLDKLVKAGYGKNLELTSS